MLAIEVAVPKRGLVVRLTAYVSCTPDLIRSFLGGLCYLLPNGRHTSVSSIHPAGGPICG